MNNRERKELCAYYGDLIGLFYAFRSPSPSDKGIAAKFKEQGIQVAAGVPFQLGESPQVWEQGATFRFGLFGLDKIYDVDTTVGHLEKALSAFVGPVEQEL